MPDKEVDSLLQKTRVAKSTGELVQLVRNFLLEGYSSQQVMGRFLDSVMRDMAVPDLTKARCAMLFSQVDERLTQGCDEELQLLFLFAHLRPLLQPN